jgi:hypothetical protein
MSAARAVVPSMLARGEGYLLQTISSAALITGPSAPGYTTTKHGALGFAEWLTLNYGHLGIRVSCLCPNAVYTGMFGRPPDDESAAPPSGGAIGEILMPEDVAGTVIEAMDAERFLILPHPRVGDSSRALALVRLWVHRRTEPDDVAVWIDEHALVLAPFGVLREPHIASGREPGLGQSVGILNEKVGRRPPVRPRIEVGLHAEVNLRAVKGDEAVPTAVPVADTETKSAVVGKGRDQVTHWKDRRYSRTHGCNLPCGVGVEEVARQGTAARHAQVPG